MKKLLFSSILIVFCFSCAKKDTKQEEETGTFCWLCTTRLNQSNYECGTLVSYAGSIPVVSRVTKCDMTISEARNYEASLGSIISVTVDATPCSFGHVAKMYTKEITVTCTQQK
jgi:hypothetical protein